MKYDDKDPESLDSLFEKKGNKLHWLVKKAQYINLLSDIIQDLLDAPLKYHVSVSNIDYGVITMKADNASWATRLRLEIPSLIQSIKYHREFKRVYKIQIKL